MINLKKVDLNLFVVFDAIYREQSITRASKILNLTQPAVSHALARLRQLFDDPLFVRHGNQMVASPLARQQVDAIRSALSQLGQIIEQPFIFEPAHSRRQFNLAMRDVLEATFLPPLLQRVQIQAPQVSIQSARISRRDLSKRLSHGEVDLFIDVQLPTDKGILQHQLLSDELVVMCARNHPCLDRKWTAKTYLEYAHAVVSSRITGPSIEDIELNKHQLQRKIQLRCQHYFAASRVVAASQMLLTMPRAYAEILAEQHPVKLLKFPITMTEIKLFMYWHEQFDGDPGHSWLRQQAISSLGTVS